MLEPSGELDFAQEALAAERHGDFGAQRLEREEALVLRVAREVDCRHAAAAQLAIDDVSIAERGVQLCNWVGHGRKLRPVSRRCYGAGFSGWLWRTCSARRAARPSGSAAGQCCSTPKSTFVVIASIASRLTRTESGFPGSESTRAYTASPAPV